MPEVLRAHGISYIEGVAVNPNDLEIQPPPKQRGSCCFARLNFRNLSFFNKKIGFIPSTFS